MGFKKMIPTSLGGIVNAGVSVYFGISDYNDSRTEGNGVISSVGNAALGFILPEVMGAVPYIAATAVPALAELGVSAYEAAGTQLRQYNKAIKNQTPFQGYTFVDGPQIATMRQAGLALAKRSKYELQQTMLGDEARFLHR